MKKIYNFLLPLFLSVTVAQFSYAQSKEETITKLKEVFSDFEIKELSPCNIHLIERVQDVIYIEYQFAPNDAVWEGKRPGVYADWKVVRESKSANGDNATMTFYFMLHNDDIEFHQRTADLLNNLATFCDEAPKTDREVVTDTDLMIFYFDLTSLKSQKEEDDELFKQSLHGFLTPPAKLLENYKLLENNEDLNLLSEQEKKDYKATKNIIKEQMEEISNMYNFFEKGTTGLPKNQFETYLRKLNDDPAFLERFQQALDDF